MGWTQAWQAACSSSQVCLPDPPTQPGRQGQWDSGAVGQAAPSLVLLLLAPQLGSDQGLKTQGQLLGSRQSGISINPVL